MHIYKIQVVTWDQFLIQKSSKNCDCCYAAAIRLRTCSKYPWLQYRCHTGMHTVPSHTVANYLSTALAYSCRWLKYLLWTVEALSFQLNLKMLLYYIFSIYFRQLFYTQAIVTRDSNPGLVFSIPGFGIGEFLIPGSQRDYRSRRYDIKNRYFWIYGLILLNLFFFCQSVTGLFI